MKRLYLLFIIALLGCINWTFGAAPQIQSVEYVNKKYETSVIRANLVVATATFDQDLYFDANCTANPVALDILPCCSSTVTTGCHTAQSTSFCIEGAYGRDLSLDTNTFMTFEFQASNPSTCDSVPIFVRSLSGDPDVAVSISASNKFPTSTNNNYYYQNTGSEGIVLCCSAIRTKNPSWDGTVYFSVIAFAATTFEVEVRDSAQSVSIVDAWFNMVPQITCANQSFTFQDCVLDDDYCQNLPPTNDPLFNFVATLTDMGISLDYVSKQISWTFASSVQIFTSAQVSRTIFPFSATLLSDSTCQVSFGGVALRNSDGEYLTGSSSLVQRQLTCSAAGFFDVSDGLTELLTSLQSSSFATEDDVYEYRLRSLAYAISNDWLGCVRLTENSLLSSTNVPTTVNSTAACFVADPTSEAYLTDPCCNPSLQTTQCCAPRDVIANAPAYQINFDVVNKTCNLPACTTNALDQYINLSEGALIRRDVCSLETQKALNNPLFNSSQTPLQTCQLQVFSQPCYTDDMCANINENSVCMPTGYCSLPCRNNTECVSNNCTSISGINTCVTFSRLDEVGDDETQYLIKCIERNMNNYVALFIRSELGVPYNAPPSTYVSTFLKTLVNPQSCLGPLSAGYTDTPTLCEQVNSCNWAQCNSLTNSFCTEQNCVPANTSLGSDNFCGFCYGETCAEVSIFPRCQYKGTFGATGSICNLFGTSEPGGAVFLGLPTNNQRCIRPTETVDDCFPVNRCTDTELTNNDCHAYCYIKAVTDSADCTGTIEDSTVSWVSWTRDATTYGICVATDHTTISACLLNSSGKLRNGTNWWPGTQWMAPRYASELTCTGLCIPNDNITDEATCLSTYYCDGCNSTNCDTEEQCDTAGTCDDFEGCVIPLPDNSICPAQYEWTPIGCYNPNITIANCVGQDHQWVYKATSKTECLDKGYACVDPSTAQAVFAPNRPPPGYSAKNESECSKCGGEILPYYEWTGAEWTNNVWFDLQWRPRSFGQANALGAAIDNAQFKTFWKAAIAKRFANIMAREVLCRYGRSQDALENIACDCGTDKTLDLSQSCVANISIITDAVVQCCRSIVENTTSQATKTRVEVHADFNTDSDVDCINLKVYSLPSRQFNSRKKITISSISASLPQSGLSDQFRYVKNKNVAAVGEIISDGIELELTDLTVLSGLYACIPLPTPNTTLGTAAYLDFAYPDDSYSFLTPLNLKLPLTTTEHCFDLSDNSTQSILFPIVLIENYEDIKFIETISPGNLALIYIGVGIYVFVLGFTAFHFIIHIMQADSAKGFWNMATSALMILFFMLILRLLYLFFLSNGVLETARQADVVFSELPALLYLTIYSLIVIRWAEIYHFTMTTGRITGINKLRPVVISVNAFLGAAFIVLAALFYNLSNTRIVNCSTPATQELTDAEKVAIAYKVIFALICLGLAITFGIYGGRIVEMMHQTAKMAGKTRNSERNKAFIRLIIVSAVCAICLLAQAGNLLHGSLGSDRSFIGVLIFLYIVEIAPAIIFIFLFKKTSLFAQSADKKKAWVSSMRSRTKSGKSSGTVLQDGTNTGGVGDDVIAELDDMPLESH